MATAAAPESRKIVHEINVYLAHSSSAGFGMRSFHLVSSYPIAESIPALLRLNEESVCILLSFSGLAKTRDPIQFLIYLFIFTVQPEEVELYGHSCPF